MRAGVPALRSGRLRRARLLRPRDRGAGRRGVYLQSEQPDGAPRRPPRDRCRGLPLRAGGRAARRGRVLPRICARRPRKERGRTRRVFAPCGRALRIHQALRNGGVAVRISDQRKRPTPRGDSPGGAGVARLLGRRGRGHRRPGRRRIRLAHARRIGGRASVAFPRALLARAFRRAVGCELPFSPDTGERHPRAPV